MLKRYLNANKKVVNVLCKHIICCSGDGNKKDVSSQEFDKFVRRFGPFENCIENAQKVFFDAIPLKNGETEYQLVRWYHGYLEDCKKTILENPDKYLVREPMEKERWHLLTVEYSKSFMKDGKKLLSRNKKHLMIKRKSGKEILYVWNTKKINPKTGQPVKNGHPDIKVALGEMTSKREPINSLMWHAVENQSLYQAASYEYD